MSKKSFPKRARLLKLKDFIFVFQKPTRIKTTSGLLLFSRSNQLGHARIGFAISKKYIKNAHIRNHIKRYARETFRINQHNLSPLDFIITVYTKNILYLKNHDLITELTNLWYLHWNQ